MGRKWNGILAVENTMTSDSRFISQGALRFELERPIPLQFVRQTGDGGHSGAVVVGTIEAISRDDDGTIHGSGFFADTEGSSDPEFVADVETAMRLVSTGTMGGVSLDLGEVTFEVRLAKDVLEGLSEAPQENEDGTVTVYGAKPDDQVMHITDALVRGATLVSIPAFKQAYIQMDDEEEFAALEGDDVYEMEDCGCSLELTAAAPPQTAPYELFDNPGLAGPTPLTIVEETGHVYGHLATWGTCHIGMGDACVTAPASKTDYAHFHTSSIDTGMGAIAVGRLTHGGGHASAGAGMRAAIEHYDEVGTTMAYVRVGEDEHGIWFSGVLADIDDQKAYRSFKSAPLSGDWRRVGGSLELVAACSVNVPGFPIPRAHLAASGQVSLVAAGAVPAAPVSVQAAAPLDPQDIAERVVKMIQDQALVAAAKDDVEAMLSDVLEAEADLLYAQVNR